MKTFHFLLLLISIATQSAFAFDGNMSSARSQALGNTGVVFRDANAVFTNQAGLAALKVFQISAGVERKFLLTDLSEYQLSVIAPSKSGTFGFSTTRFGFADFNETKIGLGFGKKLSEKFDIGIQLDYLQQHIAEQKNLSAYTVELGFISNLSKNFRLGFHTFNPMPLKTNRFQTELPNNYKLGLGWQTSKTVMLLIEANENLNFQSNFKAGLEYKPIEQFLLRCGMQTNPKSFSAGFGYHSKKFFVDFSNVFHPILGSTPHFTLTYLFRK